MFWGLGGGCGKFALTFFFSLQIFFFKNVPGVLKRTQTKDFGAPHAPPGGRGGSENDTLLPTTITHDRPTFWRSKVIIRKQFTHLHWTHLQRYLHIKTLNSEETRLLGRPQAQMYPPVALNQHTLVNRTHKHYIYMLQGPTNMLKSHQSSTICKICK